MVLVEEVRDFGVNQTRGIMGTDVSVLHILATEFLTIQNRAGENLAHAGRQLWDFFEEDVPRSPRAWVDEVPTPC
jgi:hypothetical protein